MELTLIVTVSRQVYKKKRASLKHFPVRFVELLSWLLKDKLNSRWTIKVHILITVSDVN